MKLMVANSSTRLLKKINVSSYCLFYYSVRGRRHISSSFPFVHSFLWESPLFMVPPMAVVIMVLIRCNIFFLSTWQTNVSKGMIRGYRDGKHTRRREFGCDPSSPFSVSVPQIKRGGIPRVKV